MSLPDLSRIPVLDEERVLELKEQAAHDPFLFDRLFNLFQEEGPILVASIESSLESEDRTQAHEAIHKVKGSSAAMGACRVYALASAGVDIARGDDSLGLLKDLPAMLRVEYAAYVEAAKGHLS